MAEVAAVGAYVKQYQVTIDPDKLLAYDIPINRVVERIRMSNQEVGGRVIEFTGREYMVRGRGYIKGVHDIEEVSLGTQKDGTPVRVRDVGDVQIGPDIRRGVVDYNGLGDAAGGVVVVRFGESVYDVLQRVKRTIRETVQPSLPEGVELVVTYDRSALIEHSVATLREKLIEESLIVSLVCVVFLFHFRSALVAVLTLAPGRAAGAAGDARNRADLQHHEPGRDRHRHRRHDRCGDRDDRERAQARRARAGQAGVRAARPQGGDHRGGQGGGAVALLLALDHHRRLSAGLRPPGPGGRLFKPLAYTKTFSMLFAALLSITVAPFLMTVLIRGKIPPEEKNPLNKLLIWVYRPFARLALRLRYFMVLLAAVAIGLIVPIYRSLGSEFMPPLWEGTLLYMPVTLPGASIETMREAIEDQDRILMTFPEVLSVFAKAGRAETATDPAPLEMVETVVNLKAPEQWRPGMTPDRLIAEMDAALKRKLVGFSTSWTMPIKGRIDMLSTGIRTPIGIKIFGPDLREIARLGREVEQAVSMVPGTRSAFAERVSEGYYLDFAVRRASIARYGLTVDDVQAVIQSAVGGANVTTTIEGRERFPVNVRYGREFRDDLAKLQRVLVETPIGAQVPLGELADLKITSGPTSIKSEAAQLVGYVYVDIAGRDAGSYVRDARAMVSKMVKVPPGYSLQWSGSFESMERASRRLTYVIPLTLLIIVVLLYLNTGSLVKVIIVLLAVPFSLVGAFLLLYLLGYHLSVAVWVGIIALAGVDAETGVVMLLYLDVAYEHERKAGRMNGLADLERAVMEGAVQRVRPKMMTVMAILMGLLPIMWSTGSGADVMKRIAAPMVGGIITSFILELLIYPAIYTIWRWWAEVRPAQDRTLAQPNQ